MSGTKETWESHAAAEPYYAVVAEERFRSVNLDDDERRAFFDSGDAHVVDVFSEVENHFGCRLRPKHALDFGCGVGRVVIPLSRRSERVTGIDIAKGMLDEAARNLVGRKIENVEFLSTETFLSKPGIRHDFVHSFIVFQHIPPSDGYKLIERLLEQLEPDGLGMIHVTHKSKSSALRRVLWKLRRDVPPVNKLYGYLARTDEVYCPMYEYDLEWIVELMKIHSCSDHFMRPTDHGFLGKMIFFRKGSNTA